MSEHREPNHGAAEAAEPNSTAGRVGFVIGALVLVALAAGGAFVLSSGRKKAEAAEANDRAEMMGQGPLIATARVEEAPKGRAVTLPGEVHAYRQATLFAKVSGYLKMVKVDKGDHVKSGDVLGVIEAPEVQSQVASKQADLALKKITDARTTLLAKEGLASQADVDTAKANVAIGQADLAQLATLRGYEIIRAPFDGTITARYADPGALLQAATASVSALPLVDVADVSRVRIVVYLAQGEALFAHEGDPVEIWAEEKPETKTSGKITRMAQELDAKTRTMLTEIELENKVGFYPGTVVRAKLTIAAAAARIVPADALVVRLGDVEVIRVRDGHAEFVKTQLIDSDGKTARILGGVELGDEVAAHPNDEIIDKGAVRVLPAKPKS